MGITDKDGALYFATGIDNSGLYSGRKEAMGIIKAMASEVTSFDVFGGIGVSAALAFAKAAKDSYSFQKEFSKAMTEVATISKTIATDIASFSDQVLNLTKEIPVGATESAKALYQIVSAGHDGADAMNVLEVAAKAAVGGVTDTATAADAITTVLNSYKMSASEATNVSDQLFTTVRLGKTTMGELGQSISQVSPLAASFNINIQDILAAIASLTKQGVPTAQAMTQIRAAIQGTASALGDDAFKGKTFQEAMQVVYDKANGSATAMKDLLGTQEAVQAALAVTGNNARSAAGDLGQLQNSAGATEAAFKTMSEESDNQMTLLANNVKAAMAPLGEAILKGLGNAAKAFNDAFASGDLQKSVKTMGELVLVLTTAMVGYKGSIAAVSAAKTINAAISAYLTKQRAAEATSLVLTKGMYAAEATQVALNTSAHVLLTNALKAQFLAMGKSMAAMAANPYMLAAAGAAALGYAIYEHATRETEAEKAQRKYNEAIKDSNKEIDDNKAKLTELVATIEDENASNTKRQAALKDLKENYNAIFKKYVDEKGHIRDLIGLWKEYNAEVEKRQAENNKKLASDTASNLNDLQKQREKAQNDGNWAKVKELNEAIKTVQKQSAEAQQAVSDDNFNKWKASLDKKTDKQIKEEKAAAQKILDARKSGTKAENVPSYMNNLSDSELQRGVDAYTEEQNSRNEKNNKSSQIYDKAYWDKQKADAQKQLEALSDIDAKGEKGQALKKKIAGYDKKIDLYSTTSKTAENEVNKSNEIQAQNESIKEMQRKQSVEIQRQQEDLQNQETQSRINLLADAGEKERQQRALDNKLEIQALQRQKEDYITAYTQSQKELFDAEEELRSKKNKNYRKQSFDPSIVSVDTSGFDTLIGNTQTKQKTESLRNLLAEYQTIAEQRKQIEGKYNADLDVLQKARLKASQENNTAEIEQIDGAIGELNKKTTKSIADLDFEQLKKDLDWTQVFGDLSKVSTASLETVKKKLKEIIELNKDLTPEQMKDIVEAIDNIDNKITERDPIKAFGDSFQELFGKTGDVSKAQEAYNKALAEGTDKEKAAAKNDLANARQKAAVNLLTAAQGIADYGKQITDSFNTAFDLIENEWGGEIPSGLKTAVSDVGDIFASVIEFDITKPLSSAVNVIKSVLVGMTDVVKGVFGLGGADYSGYNKMVEEYNALNDIWDELIDKKKQYIGISYGAEADKAGQEAEALQQKVIDSYRTLGIERLNSGASTGSHSIGVRQRKNMSSEGWAELQAWQDANNTEYDFGGRMEQLFQLTADQLADLQANAPVFWSKLDGDVRDYLNSIIDGEEKLEEIQNKVKESLTGVTFDSVYDSFSDLLYDMNSDSQDFADNFSEYFQKAIISTKIAGKYKSQLQEWYDSFAKANTDSDITADEQAALKKQYDDIVNAALEERNALMDAMGWSSTTSQNATSKGYNTMSQDTGDEISGRTTAIQAATEDIRAQVTVQTGMITDQVRIMQELYSMTYEHFSERSDMMVNVLDILNEMNRNIANLPVMKKLLESMDDKLSKL